MQRPYAQDMADVAKRRARVLTLYEAGRTQREIATELEMPASTVALDLKSSPGYRARSTLSSFAPGAGRLTAAAAAARFGLKESTLRAGIDAHVVRGRRFIAADGRVIRTVDVVELEADLANLPTCGYDGCDRKALAPSGACSGPHARALEMRGTKRSGETCKRISEGKRGKDRPDVAARVSAMHADPRAHAAWGVALVTGRAASPTSSASANSLRRWKGKLGGIDAKDKAASAVAAGVDGARPAGHPRGYTSKQEATVIDLRREHPAWGRATLARATGLTEKQVRGILARK